MEYGRLVVLGYSSYRVANVKTGGSYRPTTTTSSSSSTTSVSISTGQNNISSQTTRSQVPLPGVNLTSTPLRSAHIQNSLPTSSTGQLWEPVGDQNTQYIMYKRKSSVGNGVQLARFHHFLGKEDSPSDIKTWTKRIMTSIEAENKRIAIDFPSYLICVPMNESDAHVSITQYRSDPTCDLFQIGRMPCRENDFVIPGPRVGTSGTISRFAARLQYQREPPYECRIYAGGFDSTRRMMTAGHALKHCRMCGEWLKRIPVEHKCIQNLIQRTNQDEANDEEHIEMELFNAENISIDGLTKNGVRVWLPEHKTWFEVSVNGNMYAIDPCTNRSSNQTKELRHGAFSRPTVLASAMGVESILTDGAIIDLGGVQLQYQSPVISRNSDSATIRPSEMSIVSKLERLNVQCPVQLHPLNFRHKTTSETLTVDQIPHVFPACGHVFGYEERIATSKMCPLCRTPGPLVQLLLDDHQLQNFTSHAMERSAIPECVLNPCGHAISRKLATHYASLLMPNGRAICPFCAVHLNTTTPFSTLYLYSEDSIN